MLRAVMSLSGFALFVTVGVGARLWLQYRATGDAGLRIFRGGTRALVAAALFIFGFGLAPLAPLAALLRAPAADPLPSAVHAIGLCLLVLGFALTVVAQRSMGTSWRMGVDRDEQTALVTHGVFARVRNPIYTGILLVLTGMLLLVPGPLAAAALGCTWLGLQIQVRALEEPYLERVHGERYRSYARRTGRFVPGLGRMR
ncbi:MAG TPA: isoprenylcysteine carboxylmethyltransferase family protein [Myxococcota bacterium]|nr:isoprenylcysteine carboxylmethyltransferase family protein [Myxococcota bacterium]